MMNDIEKQRADYVVRLELLVQNLQEQVKQLQADEKWIPRFGSELDPETNKARLTLSFGGKNQTAVFSYEFLGDQGVSDATTNIIELGFRGLIEDRFKEVVSPEVERLKGSIQAINGAGKW